MSKRKPKQQKRGRRVSVRSVRRSKTDTRRLGQALVYYALEQAAEEAAAEAQAKRRRERADG